MILSDFRVNKLSFFSSSFTRVNMTLNHMKIYIKKNLNLFVMHIFE